MKKTRSEARIIEEMKKKGRSLGAKESKREKEISVPNDTLLVV